MTACEKCGTEHTASCPVVFFVNESHTIPAHVYENIKFNNGSKVEFMGMPDERLESMHLGDISIHIDIGMDSPDADHTVVVYDGQRYGKKVRFERDKDERSLIARLIDMERTISRQRPPKVPHRSFGPPVFYRHFKIKKFKGSKAAKRAARAHRMRK